LATTRKHRAHLALTWAVFWFVAGQVGLLVALERQRPVSRDPEYTHRLALLRHLLAESPPGRPLVLALGSSRIVTGFRPELLAVNQSASPDDPLVFNFGILGCNQVWQLMYLRRLLADGIHPRALLVEVWPAWLGLDRSQADAFPVVRLQARDLDRFASFASRPSHVRREWCRAHLLPWSTLRYVLLNQLAPDWLDPPLRCDDHWRNLRSHGWLEMPHFVARRSYVDLYGFWMRCRPGMASNLTAAQISSCSSRAMRELVRLCRREHIRVAVCMLPEGAELRRWYLRPALNQIDGQLRLLASELGFRLLDFRERLPDDAFVEDLHLTHSGARTLTRLIEAELLPQLLDDTTQPECGN
jgi:hypothetical protein